EPQNLLGQLYRKLGRRADAEHEFATFENQQAGAAREAVGAFANRSRTAPKTASWNNSFILDQRPPSPLSPLPLRRFRRQKLRRKASWITRGPWAGPVINPNVPPSAG